MAFHDIQFPTGISYRSRGGPGFNTLITEVDSGAERRISRWGQMRHEYDAREAVKSWDALYELKTFFVARNGAAHSFRFKDWQDYTSASNGRDNPSDTDQLIGVGDGSTTSFRLRKTYVSGGQSIVRVNMLPVSGTTVVSLNDVSQPSGWSVNTTTGYVTFSSPPGLGVNVKAGFKFDVPCRFGRDIDRLMSATLEDFSSGAIDSVPIIEVWDETALPEDFNYRGQSTLSISADTTLSLTHGVSVAITATTTSLSVLLPDNTSLPGGGPYFHIYNEGSNTFTLKKHDGTTIRTLTAGQSTVVWLGVNQSTGARRWFA